MSEKSLDGVWEYEKLEDEKIKIIGYYSDETDVVVPKEIDKKVVTVIGPSAFKNQNITSINLPDTLRVIDTEAFADCDKLTSVELPYFRRNLSISPLAFKGCCKLVDEQGFSIVNDYLYGYYGDEEEIEIPEQVRFIGESAFENNKKLTSIVFPKELLYIYDKAFLNCTNLSSVVFQCTYYVEKGYCAFKNCPKLADEDGFVIVGQDLFDYFGNKSNIIIPKKVYTISRKAFSDNSNLVSVTLTEPIEVYSRAFNNCPNLLTVKAPTHGCGLWFDKEVFHNCPNLVDEDGFITISNR